MMSFGYTQYTLLRTRSYCELCMCICERNGIHAFFEIELEASFKRFERCNFALRLALYFEWMIIAQNEAGASSIVSQNYVATWISNQVTRSLLLHITCCEHYIYTVWCMFHLYIYTPYTCELICLGPNNFPFIIKMSSSKQKSLAYEDDIHTKLSWCAAYLIEIPINLVLWRAFICRWREFYLGSRVRILCSFVIIYSAHCFYCDVTHEYGWAKTNPRAADVESIIYNNNAAAATTATSRALFVLCSRWCVLKLRNRSTSNYHNSPLKPNHKFRKLD
jgi:hypothetical protein